MVERSEPSDGEPPYTGDAPIDESDGWGATDGAPSADVSGSRPRRRRAQRRAFPATSFEEALVLGQAIQEFGSGQPIRRLTLFTALNRSPDSGPTRKLITSSNQYGITNGSYVAEWLELTPLGAIATDANSAPAARLDAQAQLAILGVKPFEHIYEKYKGARLPAVEVLRDAAREADVDDADVAESVETFLANARGLGLIRNIGGSEHLLTIETVVEEEAARGHDAAAPPNASSQRVAEVNEAAQATGNSTVVRIPTSAASDTRVASSSDLAEVCFVVSPIGDEGSEQRKHADLMLGSIIEPALKDLGLKAVRADKISRPGMITRQVIDHVARAKLVIADLSFGNPNVFYELALRHAVRKPLVQIARTADKLPFDVGQFRTVVLDMTDIYTLVPQLELHRAEITRQCRAAIADGPTADSPLSRFYPSFWDEIAMVAPGEN